MRSTELPYSLMMKLVELPDSLIRLAELPDSLMMRSAELPDIIR